MNATPNGTIDQTMVKLEAIADRLQRGEITMEEADAESLLVRASLVREVRAGINGTHSVETRTTLTHARRQRLSHAIFEPRGQTVSFPRLSAIWSTLFLICCVIGGLVILVRGIQLGMILQATLLSIFATSGGLLYYSRYHPERTLRLRVKFVLSVMCLASVAGLAVARKMGM